MLTSVLLPFILSCNVSAAVEIDLLSAAKISRALKCATYASAGHHRSRSGPGPDHGGDPNDEKHDGRLPANEHAGDGYPSDDPYNGSTDNNKDHPNRPY